RDGRRIGYAVTIAHLPDIGGGSFGADSRSLYEEGLLIPPRRWQRGDVENEELVALLAANVRVPSQVRGDIRAQSAARAVGARAVVDRLEDIGAESLREISAALQARAERSMRSAIAGLPDGTWRTVTTADGAAGQPSRIACAIAKQGDSLRVDYAGS